MVGLMAGAANAGFVNPETFETYSPTANFESVSDTGWFRFESTGGVPTWEIVSDGSGGQMYKMTNPQGWDTKSRWYGKISDQNQVLSTDFMLAAGVNSWNRLVVTMGDYIDAWKYTASVQMKRTSAGPSCTLYADGGNTNEALPGQSGFTWGVWYTLEIQTDRANDLIRARFGVKDGTMNDWTGWHSYTASYENYHSTQFAVTDEVHLDNIEVAVPEPATLAVLGIGGLMAFLRRKSR
jgi:hypothetical protein